MHALATALSAYKQVRQLRLHGVIARELGISILSGQYRPGELLMGEKEACQRLKVSRSSYREAVRILAAKGLIKPKTRTGTHVCPSSNWSMLDPEVLSWTFDTRLNPQLLAGLFELRDVVEPSAAGFAAARRSKEDLEAMKLALAAMERHTLQTVEGRNADQDFHAILLRASRNPFLVCLERNVRAAVEIAARTLRHALVVTRDPLPDHILVFEAIADSNAAAAKTAMHSLISLAQRDFEVLDHAEFQQ